MILFIGYILVPGYDPYHSGRRFDGIDNRLTFQGPPTIDACCGIPYLGVHAATFQQEYTQQQDSIPSDYKVGRENDTTCAVEIRMSILAQGVLSLEMGQCFAVNVRGVSILVDHHHNNNNNNNNLEWESYFFFDSFLFTSTRHGCAFDTRILAGKIYWSMLNVVRSCRVASVSFAACIYVPKLMDRTLEKMTWLCNILFVGLLPVIVWDLAILKLPTFGLLSLKQVSLLQWVWMPLSTWYYFSTVSLLTLR